ncbi:unnamed protein product [Amaranthus hypochondriacus]
MLPAKRAAGGETDSDEVVEAAGLTLSRTDGGKRQRKGEIGLSNANTYNDSYDIDEDLHSHQVYFYGLETIRRLSASKILVSGLQGLGAEIAKNLILTGVKSVTLHDEEDVGLWDLSSNFLFLEEDVGKNRAFVSAKKLQELNNSVGVSYLTTGLTKERLSEFLVVVFTNINLDKAVEYDEYCHNHQPPIAFIKSEVCGLFGSVFCDFGPKFTVVDVDGQDPHTGIVAFISNENPALITCVDDGMLEFEDGDLVTFSEVCGMTELNDGKPRMVKNPDSFSFTLDEDTTNFGPYEKGGIVTQVKQPKVLHFKPLSEALKDPGDFFRGDFSRIDQLPMLHLAFQGLDKFISTFRRYPIAGSKGDAQMLISYVHEINDKKLNSFVDGGVKDIDEKLLRKFAFGSKAVLNPMAAMFGGIVGQEVIKACSRKFHPLFQFFYFDSLESLPAQPLYLSDLKPLNSRYDAQISVFGSKLQKKLEDSKVFVVGSGALGCEFLKNLALMGVSCGSEGKLTITDDGVIKKRNLSSQFLFRDWNIGTSKSAVATAAAAAINPHLHIEALKIRVSPETIYIFDNSFWDNLNVVINALDNNDNAKLCIDKCVYYQKPFLDSWVDGANCLTNTVISNLTEIYGTRPSSNHKQTPMSFINEFPYNTKHCLDWALSEFEDLLEKSPTEVNAFLNNPNEYISSMRKAGNAQARLTLEHVIECVDNERCDTFQDCITCARLRFEDYFSNRVKELTFTFPEDSVTSTGALFWSAPKRFPRPLQFSVEDASHLHFVTAAAKLLAENYGIPIPDWITCPQTLADAINNVIVPDFDPKEDATYDTDEEATSVSSDLMDDGTIIEQLIEKLENCRVRLPSNFRMNPVQFEKNDKNHIDIIAGLANMRARIYRIPEVDKLNAKFFAGKITPAIPTVTAMASGLVCLELYKALDGCHKVRDYRNTLVNLADPQIVWTPPRLTPDFFYN